MLMYVNFKKGINLGGWLSQYDVNRADKFSEEEKLEHFKTFITENDIIRLSEWGADHVRLPFISDIVEKDGEINEEYIFFVDRCIDWCEKYHMGVLLDLHEIEGHGYLPNDEVPPVLYDLRIQEKCIFIWRTLAQRYLKRKKPAIVFELLNEVHDPESYNWIKLYKRLVYEIRQIDPERMIMIGTNEANSPFRFVELDVLDDPNIVYNFHFYDPVVFTHQLAGFSEEQMAYGKKIHYPGKIPDFIDFLKGHKQWVDRYTHTEWNDRVDHDIMMKYLKNVISFQKHTDREIYCGEYGVVDQADISDRIAWLTDLQDFLTEHHIGRAYWNYKEMDFGIVDAEGNEYNETLRKIAFK